MIERHKGILIVFFLSIVFLGFSLEASADTNFDSLLVEKGFSKEEILSMNEETKEKLATSTGEKADYTITKKEYYNSLNGKKYEVTNENRNQINELIEKDIAKYNKENNIPISNTKTSLASINSYDNGDYYNDDKLSVSAFVDKSSSNATEYSYRAFLNFTWSDYADLQWTDNVAIAWDNRFIGVTNSLDGFYSYLHVFNNNYVSAKMDTSQNLYGISGKFLLPNTYFMTGGLSQDIKVPVKFKNETGKFQAKYIHSLIPFTGAVSIGKASVNVPTGWLCQEFVLDFNIKIGN
ncbi:hypothetical protein CHH55_23180 [Niallia circulans]|uniref:hypothetical protein n=2 Tax=Niallia TaxID=2837506 RepID=UPI000BA61DB5|nr:hypothetical protein [Niallia circulans]PAD23235.1 hypothetical protein CHH62_23375 [Niallia circulans]PAD85505.1 hypothetical protein CHH55_23180 [Niallia circulans]